jgi:hypothetical protein
MHMTPIELTEADIRRFKKFLIRDEITNCLLWTGPTNKKGGYGQIKIGGRKGKVILVHRIAFVAGGGIITKEKPFVLHHCDNPICCEFSHLWAGTNADNCADKALKGRGRKSKKGWPYGVYRQNNGKFQAKVILGHKSYYIGVFRVEKDAMEAAVLAKERYYASRFKRT